MCLSGSWLASVMKYCIGNSDLNYLLQCMYVLAIFYSTWNLYGYVCDVDIN